MKRLLSLYLLFVGLGGISGCQKDSDAVPLTYRFQLLNDQGQEASVFPQNQNIIFRFQITNPTDKDVALRNPLFDNTDFLAVYQLNPAKGSGTFGKPYKYMFCEYVGAYRVPAHDTLTLAIPWVQMPAHQTIGPFCGHAETTWLPMGRYRTSFSTSLTILHGDDPATVTESQTFTREFDVK